MTRSTRGRRFFAACCAAMIGLSGCSTPEAAKPPPERTRPTVDVPQDRDEDAVVDALRRLDLCAVLGPLVPSGSRFETSGPSSCSAAGATLTVTRLSSDKRLDLRLMTLGDAKAYVSEDDPAGCPVWLPVSFTMAIEVRSETGCGTSTEVANGVVAALKDPTAVETTPRWEACMAMRAVPGVDVDGVESVDGCADRKSRTVLELRYGKPAVPSDGWRRETVDGVTVWTLPDAEPSGCWTEWAVGPAVTSHASDDLVAVVRGGDCGQVRHAVETLVPTLRKDPGEGTPQRPLLYRPDEPDQPFPGACAYLDIPDRASCAPYVETPVPSPDQLATVRDPNVSCAVAVDAVGRELGTQPRPVTAADDCYFVAPERLFQITVALGQDPLQGYDPPGAGHRSTTIAGHPAMVLSAEDGSSHQVWLAITGDASAPGILDFAITRGILGGDRLPADVIAKVEPILAGIVRDHLS